MIPQRHEDMQSNRQDLWAKASIRASVVYLDSCRIKNSVIHVGKTQIGLSNVLFLNCCVCDVFRRNCSEQEAGGW